MVKEEKIYISILCNYIPYIAIIALLLFDTRHILLNLIWIFAILAFTDAKYYPCFTNLHISEDKVALKFLSVIPVVSLSRDAMDYRTIKVDGLECVVFSIFSLDYADESTAKSFAKHRQAIIFRLSDKLRKDLAGFITSEEDATQNQ